MRLSSVRKRNAFTLIELLVVIAIIAILMALTVGVMSKVYVYLDEVKVVAEVNRLAESCSQFKASFGRYPPSKIILCENPQHYQTIIAGGGGNGQMAAFSAEYLSSAFPGALTSGFLIDWSGTTPALNATPLPGATPPISNSAGARAFILEGHECLVYFLGGIRPVAASGPRSFTGFSTDKSRPASQTSGARLGPYYEFEASRIKLSTNAANNAGFFDTFDDVYGRPYAYFAARTPGMNNYFHPGCPALTAVAVAVQAPLFDCFTLTNKFVPFWKSLSGAGVAYHKGDTFQIISAGKDKLFGCGGRWDQNSPELSQFDYMTNVPGFIALDGTATADEKQQTYDNISNVSNGRIVPK